MEQTKTNKKSKSLIVMLVAILLCIAVVLGMGGFTYAKYISSKSVSTQTAQVAKWGWQIGVDSSKLFGTKYDSNGAAIKSGDNATAVCVAASASDSLIVAPGTKGSMTFSISGSAEVRSAITVSATSGTYVQLLTTVSYEPIVWKLYSGTADASGNITYNTTAETGWTDGKKYSDMISELGNLSVDDIAPNTTKDLYYKLSWEWPFETGNDDTAKATNNLYDTILGAMMAYDSNATGDDANVFWGPKGQKIVATSTTAATVYENDTATTGTDYTATTTLSLNLTITVTQIQGTASN